MTSQVVGQAIDPPVQLAVAQALLLEAHGRRIGRTSRLGLEELGDGSPDCFGSIRRIALGGDLTVLRVTQEAQLGDMLGRVIRDGGEHSSEVIAQSTDRVGREQVRVVLQIHPQTLRALHDLERQIHLRASGPDRRVA